MKDIKKTYLEIIKILTSIETKLDERARVAKSLDRYLALILAGIITSTITVSLTLYRTHLLNK